MSESKMREALKYIEGLASADDARDLPTIAEVAREALDQPAEVVELTVDEMNDAYDESVEQAVKKGTQSLRHLYGLKAVITAHEAKKLEGV